jgi:hypothetical protein
MDGWMDGWMDGFSCFQKKITSEEKSNRRISEMKLLPVS